MVDKTMNIPADQMWDDITADWHEYQPPSPAEGWFTIKDFCEQTGADYEKAKWFLSKEVDAGRYEKHPRRFGGMNYYRRL